MKHHEIKPPAGANRSRKRVGRGDGSGYGTYSGKGIKGQKARSGGGVRPGFEGGQNPLTKALPRMRGFTNIFRKEYTIVNVGSLSRFPANSRVTARTLVDAGLVRDVNDSIKMLGHGNLDNPLVVEAHRFSESARQKITDSGGSIEEIK